MLSEGGAIVSYNELLEAVAKKENTTPEEVDKEMREALKMADCEMDPALFISLVSAKVKKTICRN